MQFPPPTHPPVIDALWPDCCYFSTFLSLRIPPASLLACLLFAFFLPAPSLPYISIYLIIECDTPQQCIGHRVMVLVRNNMTFVPFFFPTDRISQLCGNGERKIKEPYHTTAPHGCFLTNRNNTVFVPDASTKWAKMTT